MIVVDNDRLPVHYSKQMRDDIHKSAPVSRAWRSFMKHCGREADRKGRAVESAARALEKDCTNEISPALVEELRRAVSEPQQELFAGGLAASFVAGTVERGGKVMEQAVLANLSRREACGQDRRNAVIGAISDAVDGRKNSQLRAMEGHWMKMGGSDAAPAVQAAKESLQQVPSMEFASKILYGQLQSGEPSGRQEKVDLDENLLAQRSMR
jgi:hypothetical protein